MCGFLLPTNCNAQKLTDDGNHITEVMDETPKVITYEPWAEQCTMWPASLFVGVTTIPTGC
jgi:hypothetical protein